jgi:protein-disulfide isomerase
MRRMLLLSLCLTAAAPLAAAEQKPVATVDGDVAVTSEQLDAAVANKLLQVRVREYEIRRAALDAILESKLIVRRAKQLGITIDELLRREVSAKTREVTSEELDSAYATVQGQVKTLPLAEGKAKLAELMQQRRTETRRAEFLNELRQQLHVRVLLDPPRVAVDVADAPSDGPADAAVTIVEFSDFQCPYCGREAETLRTVRKMYRDSVRIVYRHFPLPIHPDAPKAAEAGACAAEQGRFWTFANALFAHQKQLGVEELKKHAETARLDVEKFSSCLDSGRHLTTWKRDHTAGEALGVTGTPALFVNGRPIYGAQPLSALTRVIDEELQRVRPPGVTTATAP